ncbi:Integral membrane hpp family protein [Thalictrum thalictroides]|uniref:Integral membrane hpp family protein n=1 Tax=Thalictrum thalictroides TaxID=46969 RepID=A0A7J6UYI5_THATH|nr:Integral membrane hpp family protein [Thalictrum thalictroides]
MAVIPATSSTFFSQAKPHQRKLVIIPLHSISSHQLLIKFKPFSTIIHSQTSPYFIPRPKSPNGLVNSTQITNTQHGVFDIVDNDDNPNEILNLFDEKPHKRPLKFAFWVLVWASVSLVLTAFVGDNNAQAVVSAATDSIRASSFGLKVANALRGSGWPDEAVVFALATLPVVELRGAIPVGYWLQLKPWLLTVLSVLGNMVPVPFIILYLKRFASFLARSNPSASRFLDLLFEKAREKAGPIEEFQWLGLMLFVAVPFPGTGAWTGAIIASILDMPFWSAFSANFFGVVLAGLLRKTLMSVVILSDENKEHLKVAEQGRVRGGITLRRRRNYKSTIVISSSSSSSINTASTTQHWNSDWKPDKSVSPSLSDIFWPSAGGFVAMAVLGKMDEMLAHKGLSMTVAPLAAVCAVLFATPSSPGARKYNMFVSQICCAMIGVLALAFIGPGWLARSTGLGASIAFMILTKSVHPPAAALPILFIDGAKFHHLNFWYALFPGAAGCILLCLIQQVVVYMKDNFKF